MKTVRSAEYKRIALRPTFGNNAPSGQLISLSLARVTDV
jgi:hypothetical protein